MLHHLGGVQSLFSTIMLNVLVFTMVFDLVHIEYCSVIRKSLPQMQHLTSTLGKWIFYVLNTINTEIIQIDIIAFYLDLP